MGEIVPVIRIFAKWDSFDVRYLYGILIGLMVLTAFAKSPLKVRLSPEAQSFYDSVDKLNSSHVVLIESNWDQGTIGELRSQFQSLVRHLFRKNVKFVILSGIATGRQFYEPELKKISSEFGKKYGEDWISCGFKIPEPKGISIEAVSKSLRSVAPKDDFGIPIEKYAWLNQTDSAHDWGLVISISYTDFKEYITYFKEAARVPYLCGVASISSTGLYPYVKSGAISGMLVGSRGGAEYEQALGQSGYGSRFVTGQAVGHLLLVIGIILGNIGMWAKKKQNAS